MNGEAAASSESGARPLPPAATQWSTDSGWSGDAGGSILPPFFAGRAETGIPAAGAPVPAPGAAAQTGADGADGDPASGYGELPADAFYIPEGTPPMADPVEGSPGAAAEVLAAHLDRLADRLRKEGAAALSAGASGDRLDDLLRTLLAGFLAGHDV